MADVESLTKVWETAMPETVRTKQKMPWGPNQVGNVRNMA